jgi:hypothetical protein
VIGTPDPELQQLVEEARHRSWRLRWRRLFKEFAGMLGDPLPLCDPEAEWRGYEHGEG